MEFDDATFRSRIARHRIGPGCGATVAQFVYVARSGAEGFVIEARLRRVHRFRHRHEWRAHHGTAREYNDMRKGTSWVGDLGIEIISVEPRRLIGQVALGHAAPQSRSGHRVT